MQANRTKRRVVAVDSYAPDTFTVPQSPTPRDNHMNGNVVAPIEPQAGAVQPADRALVTLLKLTAAADRLVVGLRNVPLPDSARACVDELTATAAASWDVLGPERRMAAADG